MLAIVDLVINFNNGSILRQCKSGLSLLIVNITHCPGIFSVIEGQKFLAHEDKKSILWHKVFLLPLHELEVCLNFLFGIGDDLIGFLRVHCIFVDFLRDNFFLLLIETWVLRDLHAAQLVLCLLHILYWGLVLGRLAVRGTVLEIYLLYAVVVHIIII